MNVLYCSFNYSQVYSGIKVTKATLVLIYRIYHRKKKKKLLIIKLQFSWKKCLHLRPWSQIQYSVYTVLYIQYTLHMRAHTCLCVECHCIENPEVKFVFDVQTKGQVPANENEANKEVCVPRMAASVAVFPSFRYQKDLCPHCSGCVFYEL